jgi:hypothetical protein
MEEIAEHRFHPVSLKIPDGYQDKVSLMINPPGKILPVGKQ